MENLSAVEAAGPCLPGSAKSPTVFPSGGGDQEVTVPDYLSETYWWAYLHPKGVQFFERQWLVNLILWGNFARLRDAALEELGESLDGSNLQVACVYGDFTEQLANRLAPEATLDVVDVAPVQLENLEKKMGAREQVALHQQDSTQLPFKTGSYDNVVVFFLLHEQPEEARAKTVQEALRVAKPGGKVVFVDYHGPDLLNPFRYVMVPILSTLEPFALDLWNREISEWFPEEIPLKDVKKSTFFGGLYQKIVITK